jgi:8-oxo-dGTP pyrophosphatase MutT (NUDIX family)
MNDVGPLTISIAAALIDDEVGRLLFVRKAGTRWFMQAGGKIEPGEDAVSALRRELTEEIGLSLGPENPDHLGRFSASAANEPDRIVEADLFHVGVQHRLEPLAEIEEAVWVSPADAVALPLAPLTRDVVLPLAKTLRTARRAPS